MLISELNVIYKIRLTYLVKSDEDLFLDIISEFKNEIKF